MKLTTREVNNRPLPFVEGVEAPKEWLLSFFLEDANNDFEGYLGAIKETRDYNKAIKGFTGDRVDVEFYPDRVVIEELYPADEDNFQTAEITLDEAEKLLLEWQEIINRWEASKQN